MLRPILRQPATEYVHCVRPIDDYAKDGEPGEVWLLCSFYQEFLRSLIVKEVQELCDLTSDWFQLEDRDSVKPFEAVL